MTDWFTFPALSDKKRKNEDGALKPKKAPKLDLEAASDAKPTPSPSSAKAKLAAFRCDQENSEKVEQEVAKENELPEEPEAAAEEAVVKDAKKSEEKTKVKKKPSKASEDDKASKFSGLLKMPFKKKEKKAVEKKVSEDDIDLEDDCAILEVDELEENNEKVLESKDADSEEDLSMTEKWASFHEENPNAVEPVPKKEKGKTIKKTKSSEEKRKKSKEVPSPKAAKSGGKAAKAEPEVATDTPEPAEEPAAAAEPERKPVAKEGPLSKFFTKAKSKSRLPSVIPAEDKDIEMTAMRSVATPLRSSPRKKPSLSSTPTLAASTPTTASPFEPAKVRAVAVAKLTVALNELKAEMEAAVAASDFLRAHEKKQAVLRVEEELVAAEEGTATPAPSRQQAAAGVSPAPATPAVTPGRRVVAVATPGAGSPMAARKLTPGQQKKKEEFAKKREALEAEKNAKKEEFAKKKEEAAKKKEEERLEKERKKEVEKRAREVALKEKEIEKEKEKKVKEEEREKKKAEKELENKSKEEEKSKKDEEKKLLDAAEKEKEMKKAQAFKSFFKKDVAKKEAMEKQEEGRGNFGVLLPRATMWLAPIVRGE